MAGANGVRNACFCGVHRFLPKGVWPPGSTVALCPAPPGNAARTGSRRAAPRGAPRRRALLSRRPAPTERGQGRAGATRPSSQSQWSCWLLVSAMLGDSVLLGAVPMEDMDLVIYMEIRSSLLIVFPCLYEIVCNNELISEVSLLINVSLLSVMKLSGL